MVSLAKVPAELTSAKRWVCWKLVDRDGKGTKVPFQVNGKAASSIDPNTWSVFDEACKASRDYSGVGFVFAKGDGLIGIDLDGCRNPATKTVEPWAKEIIIQFGTYSEVSPSGTGVKLWGRCTGEWQGVKKLELDGEPIVGKRPAIEVYQQGRYFAVTGERLSGLKEVVNVDSALEWLLDRFAMRQKQSESPVAPTLETPVAERARAYIAKMPPAISGQNGSKPAFRAAVVLIKGFKLSFDEAKSVFVNDYNPRCVPPWSDSEINHKLRSAEKADCKGKEGWLLGDPLEWDRVNFPIVHVGRVEVINEEPKTELRKTTLKQAALKHFESLKEGKKPLISTGVPDLDAALDGGVAKGEVIVIAARPSHGKSAIALQIVHHMTSNKIPVGIVSEEMSADALAKRSIQFLTEINSDSWNNSQIVKNAIEKHFESRAEAYIVEACGSVHRAIEECERMQKEHGIEAVFVDYAQILEGKGSSLREKVSDVSASLRRMANRTGLTVFLLAQFSREIEGRDKLIPTMRDLKESGQIEQDADVIVGALWPCRIDPGVDKNLYQFFVLKNRNRAIVRNSFDVRFFPERQMFCSANPVVVNAITEFEPAYWQGDFDSSSF